MDYKIIDKPAFTIIGNGLRVSTKDGENMRAIPQFWDCMTDGTFGRLQALKTDAGVLGEVMLGVCTDFASDMSAFTYLIAVEAVPGTSAAADLVVRDVQALTWAVFDGKGAMPEAIQNVWGTVMGEFLPSGEYAHGPGPDLELYPEGDPDDPGYVFQVWVPVIKK
jgi:AraC family transcriptional regulator